jgi:SanA protein
MWVVIWSIAGAVVVLAVSFVGVNLYIRSEGHRHTAASIEQAPNAQVAIVLGARVYPDGSPSPMLADDETNSMRRYVLARGVPAEDIFMDHAGFSTYDSMYRARDVFKVKDALVVTQGFHLDRAVYTARKLGLDATGVSADLHPYDTLLQATVRDWLARYKAFFDLNATHPLPRFLGPVIPIDGDGRATLG